jgi:hypothetical protein
VSPSVRLEQQAFVRRTTYTIRGVHGSIFCFLGMKIVNFLARPSVAMGNLG